MAMSHKDAKASTTTVAAVTASVELLELASLSIAITPRLLLFVVMSPKEAMTSTATVLDSFVTYVKMIVTSSVVSLALTSLGVMTTREPF
jgi:hypothetical protein